jgi:hypothetical protein
MYITHPMIRRSMHCNVDGQSVAMHSVSKQWNCKHGYIIQRIFSMESVPRPLLCNVAVNTPNLNSRETVFCAVRAAGI